MLADVFLLGSNDRQRRILCDSVSDRKFQQLLLITEYFVQISFNKVDE